MKSTNRAIVQTETTPFSGLPIAAAGVRLEDHQVYVTVACDEIEHEINKRAEAAAKAKDAAEAATGEAFDAIKATLKPVEALIREEVRTAFDVFAERISVVGDAQKRYGYEVDVSASCSAAGGKVEFTASAKITAPKVGYVSPDNISFPVQPPLATDAVFAPLVASYTQRYGEEQKARGVFNHFMAQKAKMSSMRKQALANALKANLLAQAGGPELMDRITKSVREVADRMSLTAAAGAITG